MGSAALTQPPRSGADAGVLGGATTEALNAATGVDQLLTAGVERVALGADFNANFRLGRARHELVATGATNLRLNVLRVQIGLHRL